MDAHLGGHTAHLNFAAILISFRVDVKHGLAVIAPLTLLLIFLILCLEEREPEAPGAASFLIQLLVLSSLSAE